MNEDEKRKDLVKHLETLACGPPDPQPETDAALEIFDELKNEVKHWRRKWSEAEARAAGLKEERDEFCEMVKKRTKEYEEEIIRITNERDEALRKLALVMNPEAEKLREILKCAEELDENVEILMGHKEQLRKERDDLGILAITIERQNAIRDLVVKQSGAPDVMIDGSGEDSGDPWDLTLCEIGQGFGYLDNLIFDLFGPDFEGTLDEKIKAIHEQHVGLRRERDLVKEGCAEFEEECNTLRYRVKALEDDASKLAREIGTMQEHKIKLRKERDEAREIVRECTDVDCGQLRTLQSRLEEARELYAYEYKTNNLANDLADAADEVLKNLSDGVTYPKLNMNLAAFRARKPGPVKWGPVNPVSDVRFDGKPAGGYIVTGPDGPKVKKALEEIAELADEPNPHHFAKGDVLPKDHPPAIVGEKAPCEVIPLPASMHSSARDDAPIQDLTEARKFDKEHAERERRIRLGMEVPGGITGDAELEAAFSLPVLAPWEKLWSAVTGCDFISKDLFSDRCPVAHVLREHAPPPPTPPEFERARREVMGPVESVPGTAESLPCGSVPCVTVPIKFPSGTARMTEGETVQCAACGIMFYTELVITMDDVGGPVCSRCQDKEDEANAPSAGELLETLPDVDVISEAECYPHKRCPDCKGTGQNLNVPVDPRDDEPVRTSGTIDGAPIIDVTDEEMRDGLACASLRVCPRCKGKGIIQDDETDGFTCPECKRGFIRWSELKIGSTTVQCAYCRHRCEVLIEPDQEAEDEYDRLNQDGIDEAFEEQE